MSDRTAWLAERKQGVGGSDVASVFNAGYGCRLRLWYDKRDVPPDYPDEENDAMALGSYLEPFFAMKYREKTGREVRVLPAAIVHPRYPELRVNVDRMVEHEERDPGVLELKAVSSRVFYRIKREGLSPDYILQLQHAIMVAGVEWGAFGIGCRDTGELLHWDVKRDNELSDEIETEARAFWREVQEGRKPDRLEPDDPRCHKCAYRKSCQGAALVQLEPSGKVERDETIRPVVTEYVECKKLLDEAEDLVDAKKEELKTAIGARQQLDVGDHRIYFRPQTSMRGDFAFLATDYERMRGMLLKAIEQHPELWQSEQKFAEEFREADSYRNPVESRPLRVY